MTNKTKCIILISVIITIIDYKRSNETGTKVSDHIKSKKNEKENIIMKKWVCTVCGYVYEGENPPEKCPQCGVPASKFKEQAADETSWACEHEVGVAQGSQKILWLI